MNASHGYHKYLNIFVMFLILRGLEFFLYNTGNEAELFFLDPIVFVILYIYIGIKYEIKDICKMTFFLIFLTLLYLSSELVFEIPGKWFTYKEPGFFGGLYGILYGLTITYDWITVLTCCFITSVVKIIIRKKRL